MGCLPMLAQVPVFLGLYHVLRSFNRTVTGGMGGSFGPHLSVAQNRATGNYIFSATDVGHFLDANLFGAPIGASMIQTSGLQAFTEFSRGAVVAVGLPLMIAAGVATYFNSRASVARQSAEAAAKPERQRKAESAPTDSTVTDAVEITDAPDAVVDGKPMPETPRPGPTPRPGARPKKRKR